MSKLSELVAVRVMGWAVHCRNTAHYVLASEQNDTYRAPQAMVSEFRPDTSIADAILVADRFTDYEIAKGGESYTVTISGFLTATEKTKELAICLAALRACGVSEGEITQARKDTP